MAAEYPLRANRLHRRWPGSQNQQDTVFKGVDTPS